MTWINVPQESILLPSNLAAVDAFRPGAVMRGMVHNAPDGSLHVQVAGTRVPLPQSSNLVAGQPVMLNVGATEAGLQIQISPLATPAATPQAQSGVFDLVATVLRGLGNIDGKPIDPGTAAAVIPPQFPRSEAGVRMLLSLFASRGAIGQDISLIMNLVSNGSNALNLPGLSEQAAASLVLLSSWEPDDIFAALGQMNTRAAAGPEARIAQALLAGTSPEDVIRSLESDARSFIARLRGNEAFTTYLRQTGQLESFQGAADRVLERIAASQLQNAHGVNQPYTFFEIPCMPGQFVQYGQVHILSQGGKNNHTFDARNAVVALDLSTTHLGDLWITLQIYGGRCQCRFCVTSPEIAAVVRNEAGELTHGLDAAGYAGASVYVSVWDGDRLREAAALVRSLSGLDVSG